MLKTKFSINRYYIIFTLNSLNIILRLMIIIITLEEIYFQRQINISIKMHKKVFFENHLDDYF